ncbi:MAG TPA: EAL domain-containing protein [Usitatibacter sp.]|nr:EAL domain-containing protein [Usitatibacter sp.]
MVSTESELDRLRFELAASTGDVWEADLTLGRLKLPRQFKERLGYEPGDIEDTPESWARLLHPDDREPVCRAWVDHLKRRIPYAVDYRKRSKDGPYRWFHARGQAVWNDAGRATIMAGIVHDITRYREAEARVDFLANHDELTKLPNRTLIRDRISQALAQARRNGAQFAVMFLDLDRFKVINDAYGHPTGDALLVEAACRLRRLMREEDTVARLGGDEFLVLLPNLRRSADAYVVAQKILDAFEQPLALASLQAHVNTSIGVALYPRDGHEVDTLIRNADVAMYRSKELGGGVYQFFNSEMSRQTQRRVQLETHLRLALGRNELEVRYQPKVDIASGQLTGCEALTSWLHPAIGPVPPSQFIPVAEESGLIVPIGDWVLQTACAQNKAWLDAGLGPIAVAVNVSARQFLRQDVVAWVMDTLRATGLPPRLLELELTESLIAEDPDKVAATIRALRAEGVRFSIDDFGTGYSSLGYLKRFPVDSLKIDQSFVKNVGTEPDDEAISLAVISLAHSLRLKVIAEGVESAVQRDFLLKHGCDEIQGYFFSRPLVAREFEEMLRAAVMISIA